MLTCAFDHVYFMHVLDLLECYPSDKFSTFCWNNMDLCSIDGISFDGAISQLYV